MTPSRPQEFYARPVYVISEYREDDADRLRLVFEDDAETLAEVMDHASDLARSDSPLLDGAFHAAYGGAEHIDPGDWYLTKRHGVSVSVGLAEATIDGYRDVWEDCDECGTGGGGLCPACKAKGEVC